NVEGRTSNIEHRDATAHETLVQAMVLGDRHDAESTRALASLARECAGDRWMRAAVLSGIAGRETEFFHQVEALVDSAELAAMLLCLRDGIPADVLTRALEHAAAGVGDTRLAHAQRAVFARLLGRGDWDRCAETLAAAALDNDDAVAAAAIASLADVDAVRAAEILLAPERWKSSRPIVRETTLGVLLARGAAPPLVIAAIEGGALSASALGPQQRTILLKHKDPAIRERAEKLFGTAPAGDRAKAFEDAKGALALAANGEHGRDVFKTHCAICHRLEREGVAVGPDLLDIRNQPKESILFHLIMPDAEIAPAFAAYFAETKDGRALIGVLASETATSVQLRIAGGGEETLLRTNLAKLEALPNSLMPVGLEAAMSRQDLADLLAFLKGER
ncbi:MAG TPA: c-type cytochrome, partial [Chthoniobacteraceae bacterium]|nr:c-type cytochrome [Chthoniobacteraceae bacterium]